MNMSNPTILKPVKIKKQKCGHTFNGANCKVCPYCKARNK